MNEATVAQWEPQFQQFLGQQNEPTDAAHDVAHIQRVVANAKRLATTEQADLAVVIPAAWLHDCVHVAKNSPQREQASRLAAARAVAYLTETGYPAHHIPAIEHAIEAHSFSAGIAPRTIEAKVVQDADRLDALGAIGMARCFALGGSFGGSIYHPVEPFGGNWPVESEAKRPLNDTQYSIDHFYLKLFKLVDLMNTLAGRQEAEHRTDFMRNYLVQLRQEIGDQ